MHEAQGHWLIAISHYSFCCSSSWYKQCGSAAFVCQAVLVFDQYAALKKTVFVATAKFGTEMYGYPCTEKWKVKQLMIGERRHSRRIVGVLGSHHVVTSNRRDDYNGSFISLCFELRTYQVSSCTISRAKFIHLWLLHGRDAEHIGCAPGTWKLAGW